MHSIWTRGNTIFAFTLSVLSCVTLLAFFSTWLFPDTVQVHLSATNPRV